MNKSSSDDIMNKFNLYCRATFKLTKLSKNAKKKNEKYVERANKCKIKALALTCFSRETNCVLNRYSENIVLDHPKTYALSIGIRAIIVVKDCVRCETDSRIYTTSFHALAHSVK